MPPDSLGLYLEEIDAPLLSEEEERHLLEQAKEGNQDSRNTLVERNLRLVVHLAKRFRGRGVAFEDLIEEGNLGLFDAIDRYDLSLHTPFGAYATWHIRNHLAGAIENNKGAGRVGSTMQFHARNLFRVREALKQELGREPTDEEIGVRTNLSERKIATLRLVENMLRCPEGIDEEIPVEQNETDEADEQEVVMGKFQKLPEDQRDILERLYGIGREREEIATIMQALHITKQSIYNRKERALERLRAALTR